MKNSASIRFLMAFLLCFFTRAVFSEENRLLSCRSVQGALSYSELQRPPLRVLLIPLMSWDSDSRQGERWAEQPARTIAAFYRKRFQANVQELQNVWSWTDYYQQVEQLQQQSASFDRLIFIGHGGFDGPVAGNKTFWKNLSITGSRAELLLLSESQPGLKNVFSITYNINNNQAFTDYINTHWLELAEMSQSDILHTLQDIVMRLQPLDTACFERYCSADKLATNPKSIHENRLRLCEHICRKPLFDLKSTVEISPERFHLFTDTLSSLTTPDGLIFFGACNPGSTAPKEEPKLTGAEKLINSTIAGGPYSSYVHLVSSVTDRITAGPVGESSAEDIVNRIVLFETNRPQRYLCIVAPELP